MLVHEFLERSVDRLSNKVGLICGDQRYTYAEVEACANRLAHALRARKVNRGDRVVLWLPNSLELVVGIFAIMKAGGVFVTMNPTAKVEKIAYVVKDCKASALITTGQNATVASKLLPEAVSLRTIILTTPLGKGAISSNCLSYEAIQESYPEDRLKRINTDLDLACLIYTSGSTGEPKGVMSGHDNVVFAAGSIIEYLENVEDDIVINVLPLAFDYGLYQLLMTFRFGGTLVLERSFAFPAAMLQRIEELRVTGLPGVPTVFALLLRMDLDKYDLSSIRYITNTAAALPSSHILELRQKFPDARIYSMYGLTETKRTLYLPPDQIKKKPASVGIAIPGTRAWIEDEAGRKLGPGDIGELVVQGKHVMRGYWGDLEATAERFRVSPYAKERVCYTGDLFRMDGEGYFYFVGRTDDVIKSRGEKVAPKEIEDVLYGMPGISEAAVIGVPDPILGEAIKAVVVADGADTDESKVLGYCRAHLEEFMVPKYVEFRKELPKTGSGKILKKGLG